MLKPEVDCLVPHIPFNRRTFIKAALGSSFAACVMPVSAQTVHTDSDGLEAGEVALRSGDALIPAYRAQPKGKTNLPVIIVVHEIFGGCMNISPMSADDSPMRDTSPSRLTCTRARATRWLIRRCSSLTISSSARCRTIRSCRISMRPSNGPASMVAI